jgi:hypothetical protein
MKIFASKHVYKQRLNTCRGCEHFQGLALVCKKCGCFMPAKAKIANLRCPADKWKEVYGTEDKEPETITLIDQKKTLTKEEKIIELHNRAKTLESEAKKLYDEADKLNGIK